MKFADQTIPECAILADHLQGMRVAMLTWRDTECRLVSQPMTPLEMDASGAIWLVTSRSGRTALHVQALLPADTMNLAFSDQDNSLYVSITVRAQLSDDPERKQQLWSSVARPWFPQDTNEADMTLLCLEPMEAEIWDAPDNTVVRLLALASSVVTGKPVDLSDHKKLHNLDAHRM